MPMSSLQLIMQLAQQNPQAAAAMMAQTGAQPPQLPAGGPPGGPPAPVLAGPMGSQMPTPGGPPMPPPQAAMTGAPAPAGQPNPFPGAALSQAMTGAIPSTQAAGPETLPAPGAPSPGQASGKIGDISSLMQMLMASAQKPTDRLSLGRAIAGG